MKQTLIMRQQLPIKSRTNISESRNLPTIGINLRGLPLSAVTALPVKMYAFNSYMQ